MNAKRLLIVAASLPLLTACGQHHIGAVSVEDRTPSTLVSPVPALKKLPQKAQSTDPSAYFPLDEGISFQYSRTDAVLGAEGTRTMTISSVTGASDGQQAQLTDVLDPGGKADPETGIGQGAAGTNSVTVTLPPAENTTLMSFALQGPLSKGNSWNAKLGAWNWSYVVRDTERVWVPAGQYDCVVVEGNARRALLGSLTQYKQTMYFAEGVGLVKVVVDSQSQYADHDDSSTVTEELVSRQAGPQFRTLPVLANPQTHR